MLLDIVGTIVFGAFEILGKDECNIAVRGDVVRIERFEVVEWQIAGPEKLIRDTDNLVDQT
ncbi:hypothetical protein JCM15831A_12030 [Asaia astilbis]